MNINMEYLKRLLVLHPGEKIIRIVRRSKIILVFPILLAIFLLWLPFTLWGALTQFGFWGTVFFIGLLSLGIIYTGRIFAIWYYNAFIITNHRLIDIDQQGLFYRGISEAPLGKIKEVHFSQKGFIQTLFGYGTVEVQIEGTNVHLKLRSIRHPRVVWKLIRSLVDAFHQGDIVQLEKKYYTVSDLADQLNELSLDEVEELLYELLRILKKIKKRLGKRKFRKILQQ